MNKFHTILLDQASRTVLKNLGVFVKDDINQVKDYKGHFLKVSEGYDNALIKNAQVNLINTYNTTISLYLYGIITYLSQYNRQAKTDLKRCKRQLIYSPLRSLAFNTQLWTMSTILRWCRLERCLPYCLRWVPRITTNMFTSIQHWKQELFTLSNINNTNLWGLCILIKLSFSKESLHFY